MSSHGRKYNGRKIPAWRADDGAASPLPQSPVSSQEKEEAVTLIPYAAAKLRATAFAQLGPDLDIPAAGPIKAREGLVDRADDWNRQRLRRDSGRFAKAVLLAPLIERVR